MADHEHAAGLLGLPFERYCFVDGKAKRLFDEHMLSRPERRGRQCAVRGGGSGYNDG
jgi:hypothetical protein